MRNWSEPTASPVFTNPRLGGFTESGGTLLEITGQSRSVNALKLSLGARAWRDFDLGWGVVAPEVLARWVKDLVNERRSLTAHFVADATETAFTVNGAKSAPAAAGHMAPGSLCAWGRASRPRSAMTQVCVRMSAATSSRRC